MNRRHFILCLLVASFGLLLTGCIWTRLLTLKNQFDNFERFVQVDDRDGLSFNMLKPVLLADDVRELLGAAPSTTTTNGGREVWDWSFEKIAPSGESGEFDMGFTTSFEAGKLVRVGISDRFHAIMSKEMVLAMARALGKGKVNQQKREMTSQLEPGKAEAKIEPLPRAEMVKLLGQPLRIADGKTAAIHHYEYALKSPSLRPGQKLLARLDCAFSKATDRLTQVELSYGQIHLKLAFDH